MDDSIYKAGEIFVTKYGKYQYNCDACSTTFKDIEIYKDHYMVQHLNNENVKIKFCENEYFETNSQVSQPHIEKLEYSQNNESLYDEAKQNILYEPKTALSLALSQLDIEQEEVTIKDQSEKIDKSKLKEHPPKLLKTEHKVKFECKVCTKSYTRKYRLNAHIQSAHGVSYLNDLLNANLVQDENETLEAGQIFSCQYCSNSFNNKKELLKHISNHADPYVCTICKKIFKTLDSLSRHKLTHKNKGFICNFCEKLFEDESSLNVHMKSHSGERPYQCKLCPAVFAAEAGLKVHENTKHTNGECRLPCTFENCYKIFKTKNQVQLHLRTHTGEKPFKCQHCTAAFAIKRNLNSHFVHRHTNDYNFPCPYKDCDKKFKTANSRKRHVHYVHIRDQSNQCESCGLTFRIQADLLTHRRKKHMDYEKRPFACDFCEKRFILFYQMRDHRHMHTGEKPYKCDECLKCFATKKKLSGHKRNHKKEKLL